MPTRSSFDYAVLRVVPRVEREEFINAGVILFCLERSFLGCEVYLEGARLRALWPEIDEGMVRERLNAFVKIATGARDGGPIASLTRRERFHWLTAPRSTVVQVSPVHSGLCEDPEERLRELMEQLVTARQLK